MAQSIGYTGDGLPGIELVRVMSGKNHSPLVYFIRLGDWVKIGTTTNLQMRVDSLSLTINEVVKIVPGGLEREAEFHRLFARYRIYPNREWFRRSGALKRYLGVKPWRSASLESAPEIPAVPELHLVPDDGAPGPVGLSGAVDAAIVAASLDVLRSARKRDAEFPRPVGKRGQELLYDPVALARWERNRVRAGSAAGE